jgi:putative ABC transport system ATP-binding protein
MDKKEEKKTVIELQNVHKYFRMGDNIVKAVNGVSLKIKEGDFVAIMGPSGSGKSTMMNLIGSLDVPTKGRILLDNEDISTLSESDLAQIRGKKIGFIFQSFNLINNLTAKENVMIPMIFQGYEVEDRHYRADELMKMVDLSDRKNHSPNELSGGQQQRVAIARALANSPEVILADEPTGNLDSKTGGSVMDFLQDLNNKGKTIVMVTHDADLVKDYPDIVYWLRDGKVEKVTKGRSK